MAFPSNPSDGQEHEDHIYNTSLGAWESNLESNLESAVYVSGGNVGIGTTSPSAKLDVDGNINSSGNIVLSSGRSWIGYSNSQNDPNIEFESSGIEITGGGVVIGGNGPPSSGLVVKEGDLGIGVSNPQAKIDVYMDSGTGSVDMLRLRSKHDSSSQVYGLWVSPREISYVIEESSTGTNLTISTKEDNGGTFSSGAGDIILDPHGNVGIGTSSPKTKLDVNGSLSKSSGSFKIDHPIKPDTHYLVHSFVEAPKADLLYSGMIQLVDGRAKINIDEEEGMTPGTFESLCREVRRFTTNESGFTRIRSEINGADLTIIAEDDACSDEVFWMVIGERKDVHMYETEWTDKDGKIIIEPEKEE